MVAIDTQGAYLAIISVGGKNSKVGGIDKCSSLKNLCTLGNLGENNKTVAFLCLEEPKPLKITDWKIGYCTNVHPGTDLDSILQNLKTHAVDVRSRLRMETELPVGLWIPNEAVAELVGAGSNRDPGWLRERLSEIGLSAFTINGFPYGNFHQPVVKHRVYEPAWWQRERLDYTKQLSVILDGLLPENDTGSISTLPLGWGKLSGQNLSDSAANLIELASFLKNIEDTSGRRIVIAIEPEPGCALDTSHDVVGFFDRYLSGNTPRRYLGVCHDICHAAVMNESQTEVLNRYVDHGITIGKVQVSSAIEVNWESMDDATAERALRQLSGFAEDRYLHQTVCVDTNNQTRLVEDLPQLLSKTLHRPSDRYWRIHFHVPIGLESFGQLLSTRSHVVECLQAIENVPQSLRVNHLEVETYAWGVLPAEMRQTTLAESISAEISWLTATMERS